MSLLLFLSNAAFVQPSKQDQLKAAVQKILNETVQNQTFGISVGFVSDEHHIDFGLAAGKGPDGKPVDPLSDTFLFGSGTKPYTAANIMKLVETGTIKLSEKAHRYTDPILATNGTSLAQLFGPTANNVTIDHLISMQSGLADLDVPVNDIPVLEHGTYWPPISSVRSAANCTTPMHFTPGNMTEYSSTNYMLLGMVLVAATNADPHTLMSNYTWKSFPQNSILPGNAKTEETVFPNTHFPTTGKISDTLIVGGYSAVKVEKDGHEEEKIIMVKNQSASILGWTLGNVVAPALEVARFYNALLGPSQSVVSAGSLKQMGEFNTLNYGWAKGHLVYGKGLMIESSSYAVRPSNGSSAIGPAQLSEYGVYVGHGGDTYGFLSEQGFHPALNSTISVVSNQDYNGEVAGPVVTCKIAQAAAKILYDDTVDLKCRNASSPHGGGGTTQYKCAQIGSRKLCVPSHHGTMSHHDCDSSCK